MRCAVLAFALLACDAVAQFGVGIVLPMGRSAHRLGSVPDSLGLYASRELDIEPRCVEGIERFTERIARMAACPADSALRQCPAQGLLVLRFTVARNGAIADAQVVKGGCTGLNRRIECEAQRSPAWEPGRIGYTKVATRMQVRLRLNGPSDGGR